MVDRRIEVGLSSPVATLAFLLWGLIVWAVQFGGSYTLHTLSCALEAPTWLTMTALVGLSVAAVLALLPAVIAPRRLARMMSLEGLPEDRRVVQSVSQAIATLALIAVLWSAAGMLILDACLVGR